MGQLPIKGELLIDPADSKVAIKYDPPTHSVKLLNSFFKPVTCFVVMPRSLSERNLFFNLITLYSRENIVHNSYVEVSELMMILLYNM